MPLPGQRLEKVKEWFPFLSSISRRFNEAGSRRFPLFPPPFFSSGNRNLFPTGQDADQDKKGKVFFLRGVDLYIFLLFPPLPPSRWASDPLPRLNDKKQPGFHDRREGRRRTPSFSLPLSSPLRELSSPRVLPAWRSTNFCTVYKAFFYLPTAWTTRRSRGDLFSSPCAECTKLFPGGGTAEACPPFRYIEDP